MSRYKVIELLVLLLLLLGLQKGSRGVKFRDWDHPYIPGWSIRTAVEITGEMGQSAVLPCTFTSTEPIYQGRILASWYRVQAHGNAGEIIFECPFQVSATGERQLDSCVAGNNQYRLVGDLHQDRFSLEIRNLTVKQDGGYLCQVDLREHQGAIWNTGYATVLRVSDNVNGTVLDQLRIHRATTKPLEEAAPEGDPEETASFSAFNAVQVAQIAILLLSLTVVSTLL